MSVIFKYLLCSRYLGVMWGDIKAASENKEIQTAFKSVQEMEAFGLSENVMWNILC